MLRRSAAWRVMTPRQALRVLSLPPSSTLTPASIKKAYIQQTLQCHPDLHPNNPNATENFRTLSDAFRVALKALEAQRHSGGAVPTTTARDADVDLYDPQAALESLRQAMLAYRTHQQSGGAAPSAAPHSDLTSDSPFCTPTLEDLSSVCQREAVAMRRVRTFCAELPAVLCGSQSAALFEAVAFFHARYVESMSACVMRFAQNLPLIVRRVVKQRRRYIDNGYPAVAQGIGTGTRPREQRVEDMTMKPLVLMGALIFDLPDGDGLGDSRSSSTSSSSTCGVARPEDICVSDELKCTIVPSDSIADITAKLGRWEAASFDRLKLELAIVDAARLLSGMLSLQGDDGDGAAGHVGCADAQLSVAPHLGESRAATTMVLRTLQKLAGDLCYHFDAALEGGAVADEVVQAMALHEASTAAASVHDDAAAATLDVPTLIAQCRRLAELARPTIRGNILITWKATATADLVTEDAELAHSATAPPKLNVDASSEAGSRPDAAPPFLVGRHLTCSTAEALLYAVSVVLTKDLHTFLLRLRGALKQVVQSTNQSRQVLFELLPLRERIVAEEFIREAAASGDEDELSEASPFRYRGPVQCFPRICNMDTTREHQLWKLLHAHREYVAKHAPAMNPLNVFFECLPYNPAAPEMQPGANREAERVDAVAGWVSGGSDGCDNVVVTAAQLDDAAAFRQWVEEVVEQSALHREAEETLAKAGIAYVSRDPALPLANYLSFVKLFVQSTAVRGVLERANGAGAGRGGTATPHDVGLTIIVSPARCDVRDGGRLFLPWYVDPTILLALLGDTAATPQLDA